MSEPILKTGHQTEDCSSAEHIRDRFYQAHNLFETRRIMPCVLFSKSLHSAGGLPVLKHAAPMAILSKARSALEPCPHMAFTWTWNLKGSKNLLENHSMV